MTERIVPKAIMARWSSECKGGFGVLPVVGVEAFPPGQHPQPSAIRPDVWLVQIHTAKGGSRCYGFNRAWIGGDLRMHVELLPGQERDEMVMAWESGVARN